jgi:hypothetical protein
VSDAIKSVLIEDRVFPPPAEFAASARVPNLAAYEALVARARKDPDGYWAEVASELSWSTPWRRVLDWQSPDARWFVGGKTNITVNCLDRHLDGPRKNKAALLFEGEPGDTRVLTYHQLHREVCQAPTRSTPGRPRRRLRRDLHADDPRGGDRDAGLRPPRARRTPWSSAASRPRRWPIACATPRPG